MNRQETLKLMLPGPPGRFNTNILLHTKDGRLISTDGKTVLSVPLQSCTTPPKDEYLYHDGTITPDDEIPSWIARLETFLPNHEITNGRLDLSLVLKILNRLQRSGATEIKLDMLTVGNQAIEKPLEVLIIHGIAADDNLERRATVCTLGTKPG